MKKEVCGSREQCTRSINSAIPVKIWMFKVIVGPVHSARDLLTDTFPREMHFSVKKRKEKKKKKKKENANAARPETQSNRILRVRLDTAYFAKN